MNSPTVLEIIKICNEHKVKNMRQLVKLLNKSTVTLDSISMAFISYTNRLTNPCKEVTQEVKRLLNLFKRMEVKSNLIEFREHRGSLTESMSTIIYINNMDSLIKHLSSLQLYKFGDMVTVEKYNSNPQLNWDTHIVLCNGKPVGFLNGSFN